MKKLGRVSFTMLLACVCLQFSAASTSKLAPASFAAFDAKAKAGEKLTVAFFGGEHAKLAPTCCYEYLVREMVSRGVAVQQMFFTFRDWTKPGTVPSKVHPRRVVYWKIAKAYNTPVGDVYEMPLWKKLNRGEIPVEKIWPIDHARGE